MHDRQDAAADAFGRPFARIGEGEWLFGAQADVVARLRGLAPADSLAVIAPGGAEVGSTVPALPLPGA